MRKTSSLFLIGIFFFYQVAGEFGHHLSHYLENSKKEFSLEAIAEFLGHKKKKEKVPKEDTCPLAKTLMAFQNILPSQPGIKIIRPDSIWYQKEFFETDISVIKIYLFKIQSRAPPYLVS